MGTLRGKERGSEVGRLHSRMWVRGGERNSSSMGFEVKPIWSRLESELLGECTAIWSRTLAYQWEA